MPSLSCVDLSQNVDEAVNVTVSWVLSDGGSTDFYLITITTNAPQTPYGGLLNITASASVTQYELTGFQTDYQYNITLHGVNCLNQEGGESEPLVITPQSKSSSGHLFMHTYISAASDHENCHTCLLANVYSYHLLWSICCLLCGFITIHHLPISFIKKHRASYYRQVSV